MLLTVDSPPGCHSLRDSEAQKSGLYIYFGPLTYGGHPSSRSVLGKVTMLKFNVVTFPDTKCGTLSAPNMFLATNS